MEEKKVALVTGGTKGIGGAIVDVLLQEGFDVAITSRSIDTAQKCAAQKDSGRITGFQYNIDVSGSSRGLVGSVIETLGRLDVLVNNAMSSALQYHGAFLAVEEARLEAVKLAEKEMIILCQSAFPHLIKSQGVILNIGAAIADRVVEGVGLFALHKSFVHRLTDILACEGGSQGVRVNCIAPGCTDTGDEERRVLIDFVKSHQPLGICTPEGVAQATLPLIGNPYVNGIVLRIDGGFVVNPLQIFPRQE